MTAAERIMAIMRASGATLSCAESCTGGNIAHELTLLPGASDYFLGGVVSYAVSVKSTILGVPQELISERGVVSSEVAAAMAEGVRRLTGSDYAVATTGLAGPGGDGVLPEGSVWIGVTGPFGTKTRFARTDSQDSPDADVIRRRANIGAFTTDALEFLLENI